MQGSTIATTHLALKETLRFGYVVVDVCPPADDPFNCRQRQRTYLIIPSVVRPSVCLCPTSSSRVISVLKLTSKAMDSQENFSFVLSLPMCPSQRTICKVFIATHSPIINIGSHFPSSSASLQIKSSDLIAPSKNDTVVAFRSSRIMEIMAT